MIGRKAKNFLALVALLIVLACASPSRADNLFGEFQRVPDEIERGFSVGFDFGLMFLTDTNTEISNPGFQLAFNTGYDIFDYFSIEGIYVLGINEASPLDPQLQGGVNTFLFGLAGKLQYPMGRFYPFVEAGGGVHISHPDFVRGENNKINILLGGGFEYYTYLRHYSLYAKAMYNYINDLPVDALTMAVGLKYTF